MERDPHQLIEGILIACYAVGLRAGLPLRARRDGPGPGAHRRRAQRGLRRRLRRHEHPRHRTSRSTSCCTWGAGAYIVRRGDRRCIESLEGNRGMPRLKPPFFPAANGLYLQPTIVNNVETLSNLPVDHRATAARPSPRSAPRRSHGHADVRGVRPREQARRVRGRVRRHHLPRPDLRARSTPAASATATQLKAFIPGGASAPWFYAEHLDLPLEKDDGRQGRLDARLRRHRRHGRDHRRGAGLPADRALLRPRVVRQVHAVPRGHELARADPAAHPRRLRPARATSTC